MLNPLYGNNALLHKVTKEVNKETPICKYITPYSFPEQISELINTDVTIKYRNHKIIDHELGAPRNRPADDVEYIPRAIGPDDFDMHDVYTGKFKVLRADAGEPYRFIGISQNYQKIIVGSTEIEDGEYRFLHEVMEYPIQNNVYFGIAVENQYIEEDKIIPAVTIAADTAEGHNVVLLEHYSDNIIRFTLADEKIAKVLDYVENLEDDYDVDGKYAVDLSDVYVDYDGFNASYFDISNITEEERVAISSALINYVEATGPKEVKIGSGVYNDIREFTDVNGGTASESDLRKFALDDPMYYYDSAEDKTDAVPTFKLPAEFNNWTLISKPDDPKDDIATGDHNFKDLDEDPPVEGEDNLVYNFGEDGSEESSEQNTSVGKFNFGELDDSEDESEDSQTEIISFLDKYKFTPKLDFTAVDRANFIKLMMEGKTIYGAIQIGNA